jgi:hypothetical protein
MAAPSFEQIQSFGKTTQQLIQSATDQFMLNYSANMTIDEVVNLAAVIAENYDFLGNELGAQWYDLCTRLANIEAELAELPKLEPELIRQRANDVTNRVNAGVGIEKAFRDFIETEIQNSIRQTGYDNLWRDYRRGICKGKWARVPVGDTCAWCLMLASQGAWYLSKQSALGSNGGHYHDNCNCIAVYHSDAENIPNYENLLEYKRMYYDAENMRVANKRGIEPYPEDLQQRIDAAREAHYAKQDAGETDKEWTVYNEDLIVMRYKYGLK